MGSMKNDPTTGLRYMLITANIITLLLGIVVFALCIWLMSDPGFSEWIDDLELDNYYIGIYVLLIGMVVFLLSSCVGILATRAGNVTGLTAMTGIYVFEFVCCVVGAAVLLDHSTYESKIQPLIRKSMLYLISESQWERRGQFLTLIQENIGCCGADGPNDYLAWKKPLPSECRDSVTGNAFFYGCVDELTWFLMDRSTWLSGIAMFMAFIFVLQAVMSLLLAKVLRAEDAATS